MVFNMAFNGQCPARLLWCFRFLLIPCAFRVRIKLCCQYSNLISGEELNFYFLAGNLEIHCIRHCNKGGSTVMSCDWCGMMPCLIDRLIGFLID